MVKKVPSFDDTTLLAICEVLGETSGGLTGSDISRIMSQCGIPDPVPTQTKRYRLHEALRRKQQEDGCGNHVVAFIQVAMKPVRYAHEPELFDRRREELNKVLAFAGLRLGEDGRLHSIKAARTLTEAEARAKKLYRDLLARGTHADVLRFCRSELLQDNYFHAVFEATKSVADKIRAKSGLASEGALLVDAAFARGGGVPLLAFNSLRTETERSEHNGLMHLIKGVFGAFRNVTAHEPKIKWVMDEQDALDMMSLASLLHRRLDKAVRTSPTTKVSTS